MANNQLSGTIPSELGSLTALDRINLFQNSLTGPIPTELFRKSPGTDRPLTYLNLGGGNDVSGTIPTEVGLFAGTYLILGQELTGTLPTELLGLTNLTRLDLSKNRKVSLFANKRNPITKVLRFAMVLNFFLTLLLILYR